MADDLFKGGLTGRAAFTKGNNPTPNALGVPDLQATVVPERRPFLGGEIAGSQPDFGGFFSSIAGIFAQQNQQSAQAAQAEGIAALEQDAMAFGDSLAGDLQAQQKALQEIPNGSTIGELSQAMSQGQVSMQEAQLKVRAYYNNIVNQNPALRTKARSIIKATTGIDPIASNLRVQGSSYSASTGGGQGEVDALTKAKFKIGTQLYQQATNPAVAPYLVFKDNQEAFENLDVEASLSNIRQATQAEAAIERADRNSVEGARQALQGVDSLTVYQLQHQYGQWSGVINNIKGDTVRIPTTDEQGNQTFREISSEEYFEDSKRSMTQLTNQALAELSRLQGQFKSSPETDAAFEKRRNNIQEIQNSIAEMTLPDAQIIQRQAQKLSSQLQIDQNRAKLWEARNTPNIFRLRMINPRLLDNMGEDILNFGDDEAKMIKNKIDQGEPLSTKDKVYYEIYRYMNQIGPENAVSGRISTQNMLSANPEMRYGDASPVDQKYVFNTGYKQVLSQYAVSAAQSSDVEKEQWAVQTRRVLEHATENNNTNHANMMKIFNNPRFAEYYNSVSDTNTKKQIAELGATNAIRAINGANGSAPNLSKLLSLEAVQGMQLVVDYNNHRISLVGAPDVTQSSGARFDQLFPSLGDSTSVRIAPGMNQQLLGDINKEVEVFNNAIAAFKAVGNDVSSQDVSDINSVFQQAVETINPGLAPIKVIGKAPTPQQAQQVEAQGEVLEEGQFTIQPTEVIDIPSELPSITEALPNLNLDTAKISKPVEAAKQDADGIDPFELATSYLGKSETADKRTLSAFFKETLGRSIDPSKVPWCAAFVNALEKAAGREGTGSLMAKSFLKYGEAVDSPQRGDIVVFNRTNNPAFGHVGLFAGYEQRGGQRYIKVLGGNQGNRVSIKSFPESRLAGIRRPPNVDEMSMALQDLNKIASSEGISTDES